MPLLHVGANFTSIRKRVSDFLPRLIPTERQRVLALTVLCGAICGLVAVAFHVSIGKVEVLLLDRAMTAQGYRWIYLTILTPAIGGLLVGLGLRYWVPGAVGSGIPQVKVAYALEAGWVPFRDAVAKS